MTIDSLDGAMPDANDINQRIRASIAAERLANPEMPAWRSAPGSGYGAPGVGGAQVSINQNKRSQRAA